MNKKHQIPDLSRMREIDLPPCTFCKNIPCKECAYFAGFETDGSGYARCVYRRIWKNPKEGCEIGTTHEEAMRREQERYRRQQMPGRAPWK